MADVKVRMGRYTSRSSTENRDIRLAGLGRSKAVLVLGGPVKGDTSHALFSVGAYDGTSQRVCTYSAQDGQDISDTKRWFNNANCFGRNAVGTDDVSEAIDIDALLDDAVDLNLNEAAASEQELTLIGFGGADVQAHVGDFTMDLVAIGNTVGVTGLGFQPDLIFFFSADKASTGITNGTAGNAGISFGVAVDDGSLTQRCLSQGSTDASASGVNAFPSFLNNRVGHGGGGSWQGELTSFDADGFTVTTRDATGTKDTAVVGFLALKLGVGINLRTITTPTATGSQSYSTGWRPQSVIAVTSTLEVENTTSSQLEPEDDHFGAFVTGSQWLEHYSMTEQDGSSPSVCKNRRDTSINVRRGSGTTMVAGDVPTFTSDGYEINYTTVHTAGQKWWALAIQENTTYEPPDRIDVVRSWLDVTNPPGGLQAAPNNAEADAQPALQAIIDKYALVDGSTAARNRTVLYVPPGDYLFNSTLQVSSGDGGGASGLRMQGAGIEPSEEASTRDRGTRFLWNGDSSGPLIRFNRVSGTVCDGINFRGRGTPTDLVVYTRSSAGILVSDSVFMNCSFHDAGTLFNAESSGGVADFKFIGCVWENDFDDAMSNRAVFLNSQSTVNFTFFGNKWKQMPLCIDIGSSGGGHLVVDGAVLSSVNKFVRCAQGSFNHSADSLSNIQLDGGSLEQGMHVLYDYIATSTPDRTVAINNLWMQSNDGNMADIVDWTDGTPPVLTVGETVRNVAGDTFAVVDPTDGLTQQVRIETLTVQTKISTTEFEVDKKFSETGLDGAPSEYKVKMGEGIVNSVGGARFIFNGGKLNRDRCGAYGLARLEKTVAGGFDMPSYIVINDVGLDASTFTPEKMRDWFVWGGEGGDPHHWKVNDTPRSLQAQGGVLRIPNIVQSHLRL